MATEKKRMKCVIYARQSSGKEENSASVAQQFSNCRELAKAKKLEIIGEFQDCNTSGRTYPVGAEATAEADCAYQRWFAQQCSSKKYRDGLGAALALLGSADYLLMDDITRLCRPIEGSYLDNYLYTKITGNQVKLLLVRGGVIDLSSFSDRMSTNVLSCVNDNQLLIQKQKSMNAKRALVDDGYALNVVRTFGLIYKGNKEIAVDQERAEVIRYVYDEIEKMRPYQQIMRECQQKYGHLFKSGKFYETNLRHIAQQPLYCGYMRNSNGEIIRNRQMEGQEIISYEQWKSVQEIMSCKRADNYRTRFRTLPFSRLLCCGNCGAKLVSGCDRGQVFYHCAHGVNTRRDPACSESRIAITVNNDANKSYTGLAKAMAPMLLLAQYQMLRKKDTRAADKKKLEQHQVKLDRMTETEQRMIEAVDEGYTNFEDMKKLLAKHASAKRELREKINDIIESEKNAEISRKRSEAYFCSFEKLISDDIDPQLYEQLLRMTIDRIEVFADKINIVTKDFGDFPLARYLTTGGKRHFPKFSWKRIPKDASAPDDLRKCCYEVTYYYNDQPEKKLIVDFSVLRLYSAAE
jgi:DNA invertase Pin-like site-specific DNA recombinase